MTRRLKFSLLTVACIFPLVAFSQFEKIKDSVVELYGIVMTADSLKALQGATVSVKDANRATTTNESGLFRILANKGDLLLISFVGYKPSHVRIPDSIPGNQYSAIVTMVTDTQYLAVAIVRARPTRAQFERDFIKAKVDEGQVDIARQNTNAQTLKRLSQGLAADGREATASQLASDAQSYYSSGQVPRQNIFDLVSWKKFIEAWKRGDYKKKSSSAP